MSRPSAKGLSTTGRLALWVAFLAVLLVLSLARWPSGPWLQTGFDTLLPGAGSNPWASQAARQSMATIENQLLLLLEGPPDRRDDMQVFLDSARAKLAARHYVDEQFEFDQAERWRALVTALHPHRHGLLTPGDAEKLAEDADAVLARFRGRIYSPLGVALAKGLVTDPAGLFNQFVQSAIPSPGMLDDTDHPRARELALLRIRDDALAFSRLEDLYRVCLELNEEATSNGFTLAITGTPLYSAYGVHSGRQELSTVGLASAALLVLLLLWVLRSGSALLLALAGVATGLASALLLTVSLLGQIHVLTLVFGATLIGISADYAFHFLAHSLAPGWRREHALGKVFGGLSLAFVSSSLAFGVLLLLPFPGLRQIGLFMAAGLLGAYLTVCLFFPAVYSGPGKSARLPRFSLRPVNATRFKLPLLLATAVVTVPGLLALETRDDVRDFYAKPPGAEQDQALVGQRLDGKQDSRFFLVTGSAPEELLQHEEALIAAARPYIVQGRLSELSGISRIIPSVRTQRQNFRQFQELAASDPFSRHLDQLGISADARSGLAGQAAQAFNPATPALLDGLELPLGAEGYLGCAGGVCASWVRASGTDDPDILPNLAESLEHVELVDRLGDINAMMKRYRVALFYFLLAGAALATLVLSLAAGWRRALSVMMLPALACLLSLASAGYLAGSFSIINVLALFLVFGVSVDFAVFRVFTPAEDQPATSLAITMSAATSILAFGMLGFSRTPLISAFGISIASGLLFAWALSWFLPGGEEI